MLRLDFDGTPRWPLIFAGSGTLLAGYCNGIAYGVLGNLYVSFMSGNSAHLGQQLTQNNLGGAALTLGVIGSFVAGVAGGTAITDRMAEKAKIAVLLGAELGLVFAAVAAAEGGSPVTGAMLLVVAMGLHGLMHRTIGGVDMGRGFITGYLFSGGQALAQWRKPGSLTRIAENFGSWLLLVIGVWLGAGAVSSFGFILCLGPAAAALLMLQLPLWRVLR